MQMKKLLRKVLLIVVLFAPLFINTDCKKQKKCGCPPKGDILYEYGRENVVYFDNESSTIIMYERNNYGYYDSYSFCNPDKWRSEVEKFRSGVDVLVVRGSVYWDCQYVMNSSSSSSGSYSAAYQIYVTDIYMDMYGKDENEETLKRAQ
jgi:hypothetical protein